VGPWSEPQLIFNDCRDKGLGNFMFYYYPTPAANDCAGLANSSGPSGPTIGSTNDPTTTRGTPYGPAIVERFTIISGSTLKIFYLMSTWNPYATVMMESDFTLAYGPQISLIANAESGSSTISPNTWVEIKGTNLSPVGDSRIWQMSDFTGGKMPINLDGVGATVNGTPAYIYYISPTQVNVLTPPGAIAGNVNVVLTNNGTTSATVPAPAQALSPSFFVFNGGPYVAATHVNGNLIGPTTLYPGASTPAAPGETVVIYANGFGATNVPVTAGSLTQSGTLSPLPTITIGGVAAAVTFAGLVAPGEYQFNVVVPGKLANGDQTIVATYNGQTTRSGTSITVHN
jgi:uncharacterized protein (TIGR03437 family)